MFKRCSISCGCATGQDSQGGFNLHMMALRIPILSELGTDQQIAGVYATTSRQKLTVLRDDDKDKRGKNIFPVNRWVQGTSRQPSL